LRTAALRIGLTGGIGSGKSTVASFWVEAGATVIDSDAISRQLTGKGGAALPLIAAEFGADLITADGAMDRARMRELAFADPGARRRLEAILHPLISEHTQAAAAAASSELIVFDVPLLVESGRWRQQLDRILVVDCPEALQIERVMQRSQLGLDAVRAIMRSQADRALRRASADALIHNESLSLSELRAQVLTLARRWQGRF